MYVPSSITQIRTAGSLLMCTTVVATTTLVEPTADMDTDMVITTTTDPPLSETDTLLALFLLQSVTLFYYNEIIFVLYVIMSKEKYIYILL